jgi:hypothetical protein
VVHLVTLLSMVVQVVGLGIICKKYWTVLVDAMAGICITACDTSFTGARF